MLWVLNQSDGSASLLDVAQRSGIGFAAISAAAGELAKAKLLRALDEPRPRKKHAAKRSGRRKRPNIRNTGRRK